MGYLSNWFNYLPPGTLSTQMSALWNSQERQPWKKNQVWHHHLNPTSRASTMCMYLRLHLILPLPLKHHEAGVLSQFSGMKILCFQYKDNEFWFKKIMYLGVWKVPFWMHKNCNEQIDFPMATHTLNSCHSCSSSKTKLDRLTGWT